MEKINSCPICEKSEFSDYATIKDYSVSKELFHIVQCINCHFLFINPRPTKLEIIPYYESEEYISHTDQPKGLTQHLYKFARKFTLQTKIKLIEQYCRKGKILDYGCGTGDFLNLTKQKGWIINGVEPNNSARNIANIKNNDTIYSTINEVENDKFDVITLWHVLEHIHDLNDTMLLLKNKLKKDGTLIIAVPNYTSYDQQQYEKYWAAWDVPRHIYHFTENDIKNLTAKFDLTIIDTKGMKLDAFYVSLLSEKYKTTKQNYIRAFYNGLISNIKAKKQKNYSSKIYIIKN